MITYMILFSVLWNHMPDYYAKADNFGNADENNRIRKISTENQYDMEKNNDLNREFFNALYVKTKSSYNVSSTEPVLRQSKDKLFTDIAHRYRRDVCAYCRYGQNDCSKTWDCDVINCTEKYCKYCPEEKCTGPKKNAAEQNKSNKNNIIILITAVIILIDITLMIRFFFITIDPFNFRHRSRLRQGQRRSNLSVRYSNLLREHIHDQLRENNGLPTNGCSSYVMESNSDLNTKRNSPPSYDECCNQSTNYNTIRPDQSCSISYTDLQRDRNQPIISNSLNENQQVNTDVRASANNYLSYNEAINPELNDEHNLPPLYEQCCNLSIEESPIKQDQSGSVPDAVLLKPTYHQPTRTINNYSNVNQLRVNNDVPITSSIGPSHIIEIYTNI